jgi:hypothetical protein
MALLPFLWGSAGVLPSVRVDDLSYSNDRADHVALF